MDIRAFFDPETWTLTYLVWDPTTRDAVIIDPVLDFDPLRVDVGDQALRPVLAAVAELGLTVHVVLDTHAHADHLSGSFEIKKALGAKMGIGAHIGAIQETFVRLFNLPPSFPVDGSQWDLLLADGEVFHAGSVAIQALHCPGHTPACVVYRIGDALFTGDVMFMPDYGTGRCDFPGGSAVDLYESIQRLYQLPDETRVFVGHDYLPNGRALAYETSIGASKTQNKQLAASTTLEDFVAFRTQRDATLTPPKLIFQALQVNIDAGRLPAPDDNGRRYLRLPMGVFPKG